MEFLLVWLLIGAIVGFFAGVVVKDYGFGLFDNSVVGIIGAVLAGSLIPRPNLFPEVDLLGQIISATFGAIGLLVLISIVRRVA